MAAANPIDGTAGGAFADVPGTNIITFGSADATLSALLGADTVLAGSGSLAIDAAGDPNSSPPTFGNPYPITVQGGSGPLIFLAGSGDATVTGSTGQTTIQGGEPATGSTVIGTLSVIQMGPTTILPGNNPISISTNGDSVDVYSSTTGTGYFEFTPASGDTLTIAYDSGNGYVNVTDQATGVVMSIGDGFALDADNNAYALTVGPPVITALGSAGQTGSTQPLTADVPLPVVIGTATPYSTVTITEGAVTLGTAVADAGGNFAVQITTALTDGNHSLVATAASGYELGEPDGTSPPAPVTILPTPPTVAAFTDQTGVAESSGTTTDQTPLLSGAATDGSVVIVYADGTQIGSTEATAAGWSLTPAALGDGTHMIVAYDVDPASGFSSAASAPLTFTIVPVAPSITGLDGAQAGVATADKRPVLTGTAPAGTSVAVYADGTELGMALVTGTSWSFTPATDLGDGAHEFTAFATDPGSDTVSAASAGFAVTILPAAPTVVALDANGPILAGSFVTDAVQSLGGTTDSGTSVSVYDGGTLLGQATVSGDEWSLSGLTLADGTHAISAVATDADGDQSAPSPALGFTITPPAPVIATAPGTTTDQEPTLSGTTVAGTVVAVFDNGAALGSASVVGTNWSFAPAAAVGDGVHDFTAVATDAASGETSPASAPVVMTIAPVSPAVDGFTDQSGPHEGGSTLDQTPVLSGTTAGGTDVVVYEDGTELGSASVSGSTWSYVPTVGLGDGLHTITAVAEASGVPSAPSVALDIDVIPAAPSLNGPVDPGATTTQTQPALSGTTDAGTTVEISDGGVVLGAANVSGTSWSFTPSAPLADGPHSLTAVAMDLSGDSSAVSAALAFDVVPAAPRVTGFTDTLGTTLGDGGTTDQRAVLNGTAPLGSAVYVYEDDVLLGSASVSGGAWSYTPTADLGDGTHLITAVAVDLASDEASAASGQLMLSVTPNAPVVTSFDDGSGVQATGGATLDQMPVLSGTTDAGTIVVVSVDGIQLGQALVAGTQWTFLPPAALGDGPHVVTAMAIDAASLTASEGSGGFDFTVTPAAPVVDTVSDTGGVLAPGGDTPDQRPVFAGTTDAGTQVSVYDGTTLLGAASVSGGAWTFTPGALLAAGTHSITAVAVDGDSSAASAALVFTVDPQAPVVTGLATGGNGATASKEPTIVGSAVAGGIVAVFDGGTLLGSTGADAMGAWQFTPGAPLADGTHIITAAITDGSGTVVSLPSAAVAIEILPAAPSVTSLDNGVTVMAGLTSATSARQTPTVSGTNEPGTVVSVYDGTDLLGQTGVVGASGAWSFTPQTDLTIGLHEITATASADGLAGAASIPLSLLVDPLPAIADDGDPLGAAIMQGIAALVGGSGDGGIVYIQPGQTPPAMTAGGILGVSVGDDDAGETVLPGAAELVSDVSSGPVTVNGAGGATQVVLATGSGGLNYYTGGGSGVVDAEQSTGPDLIATPVSGGGNFVIATGSGNDELVVRSGNNSLSGGAGDNLFFLGTGTSLVESAGVDTVVASSGSATVLGGVDPAAASSLLLFGGSGDLTLYQESGNATVVGGAGSETVVGGPGHSLLFGGKAGNNLEVSGAGASTLLGGGANDVLIATGGGNDILAAEGDNATLSGGGATGNNVYFGGSGHSLIAAGGGTDTLVGGSGQSTMFAGSGSDLLFGAAGGGAMIAGTGNASLIGGGGSELYAFFNGRAGGTVDIFNFNPQTDHVTFEGYNQAQIAADVTGQLALSGSTYLSLPDGTKVFFIGLSHLNAGNVV